MDTVTVAIITAVAAFALAIAFRALLKKPKPLTESEYITLLHSLDLHINTYSNSIYKPALNKLNRKYSITPTSNNNKTITHTHFSDKQNYINYTKEKSQLLKQHTTNCYQSLPQSLKHHLHYYFSPQTLALYISQHLDT